MKDKIPEIGAQARAQIAENLPKAIERTVDSYHTFMDTEQTKKQSDEFKSRHAAAKTALAHIELLMKLATMVEAMNEDDLNNIALLIQNAKTELSKDDE